MMPRPLHFQKELVDPTAWLAPGVIILGDVTIGAKATIWFNAVIRGDAESIKIGAETNIQDGCILHADPGYPCIIGDRVTVGHAAIVHGAKLEDDVMIGMRAVVMNGAIIGGGSLVGVGAVVPEGKIIPPNSLVLGVPGKIIRQTTEEDLKYITYAAKHYVDAGVEYREKYKPGNG
jgi:carbonic anhydrase/acetyltransferase-like protein (isoleucine patch superfamily)